MKFLRSSILISFSFLLLIPNFLNVNIIEDKRVSFSKEKFDPALVRLNSLVKLEAYVDSVASIKNINPNSLAYAIEAESIVSQRFYHKYATQDLNENWIASVCQKITGYYLSSKVTADDILKKPYGYCGQQNTVLMELLLKKNFDYRVVYFPHHFAIQSYINGQWCFFDADQEPQVKYYQRGNQDWLNNIDSLSIAYGQSKANLQFGFGSPVRYKLGKINEIQGRNAQLFQSVTKWLSRIAFLFPLLLLLVLKVKQRRPQTEFKNNFPEPLFDLSPLFPINV
jgi:hypothetical protein